MPAFTVPNFDGSILPTTLPSSRILLPATSSSKPPAPRRCHPKRAPEPSHDIDKKILDSFCTAEPGSLEAADLIEDIAEGHSDLFKIPRKRQIALLYKGFQHHWLQSLCRLHPMLHINKPLIQYFSPFP
jgi:hypothetical protein